MESSNLLADTVKVTLGPQEGDNVVLGKNTITRDGVSVANRPERSVRARIGAGW